MGDGSKPPSLVLAVLFIFSAYLALTETALSSVSKTKLKAASDKGDSRAKNALYLLDNFDDAITAILIYANITHISIASIVTVFVTRRWGLSFVTLSTIVTTVFVFFACEMLPKSIGKKMSFKLLLSCSSLLVFLMKVAKPFVWLLKKITSPFTKTSQEDEEVSVTEDELQDIIEDMAEEGTIDESQSDLLSSALQFGDLTAEGILTPRVDLAALDIDSDPQEAFDFIRKQTHSRIPVYKDSIDNIIGVLQIRKYLRAYLHGHKLPDLKKLIDNVYYAHESTEIHELLKSMSQKKINMAVITDSYGGTLGIVTVEDILEELVGEIWDEDDVVKEPIIQVSDRLWIADAEETVEDVFEFIGFEDPQKDEHDWANLKLGEFMFEHFSSIPKVRQSFNYKGITMSVAKIEHNRIYKVKIFATEEAAIC